jgi:arylsulfatase A-like enzyme
MAPGWTLEQVMPKITAAAVRYIDRRAVDEPRRPFFLYFALTAPHTPIVPVQACLGKSQAGRYGDYVFQVDHCVGKVMEALKRGGLEKDTLVFVTSDNGSPARDGERGSGPVGSVMQYGHHPSGILRGLKADAWEGGHRVPFIARWPEKIKAGTVCDETISLIDFFATTAALMGERLPDNAGEDSYSILPVLFDEAREGPIREALVSHSGQGMFAIRQGDWKLILGRGSGGFSKPSLIKPKPGEPKGQLYHLKEDLGESRNLYLERQDVVERLTRILERYKIEGRSVPRR